MNLVPPRGSRLRCHIHRTHGNVPFASSGNRAETPRDNVANISRLGAIASSVPQVCELQERLQAAESSLEEARQAQLACVSDTRHQVSQLKEHLTQLKDKALRVEQDNHQLLGRYVVRARALQDQPINLPDSMEVGASMSRRLWRGECCRTTGTRRAWLSVYFLVAPLSVCFLILVFWRLPT